MANRDEDIRWGSGKTRALVGRGFPPKPTPPVDPRVIAGPRGPFCGLRPVESKRTEDAEPTTQIERDENVRPESHR